MRTLVRAPGTPPAVRRATRRRQSHIAIAFGLIIATAAACSSNPDSNRTDEAPRVSHVHAIVTNPADGTVLAATHQGVFKIEGGKATLVGQGRQDTMGLAVVGPNRFYASGHPEAGTDSPPHLGLIASDDGAKTWKTMSLAGKADFHTLVPTKEGLYAYNSLRSTLMYSPDGKDWADLFEGSMHDIAVDPDDPGHLLLTTENGLQYYRRGSNPKPLDKTGGIALVEWANKRTVAGLTVDGEVLVSTDAGRSWLETGRVKGGIEALGTNAKGWQVATTEGIFESTDEGKTWRSILSQQ